MRRLQLIEIEDQPWCPAVLRDAATDYLAFVENLTTTPYEAFVEQLAEALSRTGTSRIIDLCTGGGGPIPTLARLLEERRQDVRITLTDLHPNRPRLTHLAREDPHLEVRLDPVDARHVPAELEGLRLICQAFHHFPPDEARAILQDAVDRRAPIAIFELVGRTPGSMLGVLLSPPFVLLGSLFLRPWSWKRLFFTWILPLIPLLILFDGIVSCLRIYDRKEIEELIAGVSGHESYTWRLEQRRFGLGRTTELVAWPSSLQPPAGSQAANVPEAGGDGDDQRDEEHSESPNRN